MKYTVTSAEANKLLKNITDERNLLIAEENQTSTFNAAIGEDIESVRPDYDYDKVQKEISECNRKIRAIKHAINLFNTRTTVGDTGMTIDEVLVYIPQLSEKKSRLNYMMRQMPKQRARMMGTGMNAVIDYIYTNYDVKAVKEDYLKVSDELNKVQTALDLANSTLTIEIEV